ncbi:hypothetical protein [Agromyces larvae]|uniref:Uncharacterized protein n=1 Tax=Agromyces larvae TaxID=2929802 RepID=A0ABY4C2S9_9MICO|nr:hypothetical protein [Agromyces larvae]UOE45504.1 hypothetical protein MTO99_07030 [Agromyces larvae]
MSRPEWWEVNVGNLIAAGPEAVRAELERLQTERDAALRDLERARDLAAGLEQELAHVEGR